MVVAVVLFVRMSCTVDDLEVFGVIQGPLVVELGPLLHEGGGLFVGVEGEVGFGGCAAYGAHISITD